MTKIYPEFIDLYGKESRPPGGPQVRSVFCLVEKDGEVWGYVLESTARMFGLTIEAKPRDE